MIRALSTVLHEHAVEHLAKVVPEDYDVVVSISTVAYVIDAEQSDGSFDQKDCVRVHLWVKVPELGERCVTSTRVTPSENLEDGDVGYLSNLLDEMWEGVTFTVMAALEESEEDA